MSDICQFMQYRFTEEDQCTASCCAECKIYKALKKQEPKKVDRIGNKCPVCGCYLASKPVEDHYCFNCGQAIDWTDTP